MPKVEYSKAKGLVQSTGSGFVMASETLTTGTVADPGVALTICGASIKTVTLANGTSVGQLKWFVGAHADTSTIAPTTTDGLWASVALTEVGDSAMMVWSGTGWALLSRSGSSAAGAGAVAAMPVIAN